MPVLENVRPRQRDVHPSKRGQPIIIEPFNPAWQSNATVGSRERVEKHPEIQYTWKRGTEGGLSERDIIVQPILGSRGDFNKQPIAKVIDPDNIHLRDRNSVKKRYKSKTACEGALRRNNWVIYVQTAIQWVSTNEKIKYPQAISDIILQGMYFAQIQTDDGLKDAPINPEVYLMLYKGATRNEVLPLVERSVERNENYFTTDRTTVLNAYRRFCDAEGRDATNGLSPWERYGDHSHDLDEFIQNRQNMINNNPINPSQRLIDILREPVMPGARNIVGTPVPMTPVRATTPIVSSTPQSNGSNGGFDTGGVFDTPVRGLRIGNQTPESTEPIHRHISQTPTSSESIQLTIKPKDARRTLFTSSSQDPYDHFHKRLETLPTYELTFVVHYTYFQPLDSLRDRFLPPFTNRGSPFLPKLDNMREAFKLAGEKAKISTDFLEILCGCLIHHLFKISHLDLKNCPLFITRRSLLKSYEFEDQMATYVLNNLIYILSSDMDKRVAILTRVKNLHSVALGSLPIKSLEVKHFVMVTNTTDKGDISLTDEATDILFETLKFLDLPTPSNDNEKIQEKYQFNLVTNGSFPIVFVMMFYQILENSKKMAFGVDETNFFLCNMIEIVNNTSSTSEEKLKEIIPIVSNKTYLFEEYAFRTDSSSIPIQTTSGNKKGPPSPAARNLFNDVPAVPPIVATDSVPSIPIREKPVGKVANLTTSSNIDQFNNTPHPQTGKPWARARKNERTKPPKSTIVDVPVAGVESEPIQKRSRTKTTSTESVRVRAEGKRQLKQRESYSPSPFKKQRKK